MRLFVAVEISSAAAAFAANVREVMEQSDHELCRRGLKWVDAANLHLTVRFIGDVDASVGESVSAAMTMPLEMPPFGLEFGRAAWMPGPNRPRVLMLPIAGEGTAPLATLKAAVEGRLPAGVRPEEPRAFRPHLTLARVRDDWQSRAQRASEVLARLDGGVSGGLVTRAILFESYLGPRGPRYVERASMGLIAS